MGAAAWLGVMLTETGAATTVVAALVTRGDAVAAGAVELQAHEVENRTTTA